MTTRQYSSRSQQTTLTGAITSGATSMTVVSGTALLGGVTIPAGRTFTLVIDVDTALEEIVDATAVSTNTFTITRARDGSSAQDHSAGAVVRHMAIGRDYRDANLHAEADAYYNDGSGAGHTMHGIGSGEGVVVGTDKTQTLTNKTLTSPVITNPSISGAGVDASIVFEGATADAYETTLTVVDPTQDNTITLPNTTGTVVLDSATQTLTNKTLTSPVISGSPVITGLSSAGMVSSSATPKDYVDSILGSATAAATSAASAATSASSAATSASSAATSASNALTSANSASTSATAAATSAASAATSATAAATSATSAAASASAASTSASSAATSASSALTSANSASTSASSALTSANSAATSASTMAASVAAAATSAASAATSATAAATSATSAAVSATAAATSASSAATSASSALTSANSASASATAAATSETNAAASATAAATSATSAAASATAAATSATSAAASATAAATSATSAAASATSAEAAWDSFDDRYLGPKSTPPTVDNDGNPLTAGVIYYNTGDGNMYVYSGSAWVVFTSTGDITAVVAGTGLSGGGTSGSVTLDLANTAVTAGSYTYTSLTVDAQGRLTAASSGTAPVTSVTAGSGISVTGTTTPTVAVDSTVLRTTGGQVISANTSANALEIRQIGAGNALVVEDAANPDASPFTIAADGKVTIGSTAAVSGQTLTENSLLVSTNNASGAQLAARKSFDGAGNSANLLLAKSRGTAESPVIIQNGDTIGNIIYAGFDGTNYIPVATITALSNGTPGTNDMPGALFFATTADGASAITERMRIDSAGNVGINTTTSLSKLSVLSTSSTVTNPVTTRNSIVSIRGGNDNNRLEFYVDNSGATSIMGLGAWNTSGGNTALTFYTGPNVDERMRIDSSGNTTINAIADATTTTAASGGGFMGIPQNATTTGSYTIVAGDAGKHIYSTATRTVTIPANGSVAFPVGTVLTFISGVGATTTIAITTDTMYLAGAGTTGSRTLAAHGMATAVKVASTTWYISGNGLT